MNNALTIDLEEWYHPYNLQHSGVKVEPFSQAEAATLPILELMQRYGVKATFFVVGELAQAQPHLMERILAAGHELACHGWSHLPLWELSPDAFAAELEQFLAWRDSMFTGVPVLGYRAPTFSLDDSTAWAVKVLVEHGFRYDSSIFPAKTPLYGVPSMSLQAFELQVGASGLQVASDTSPNHPTLHEIPMSVFPMLGQRIGFTGGLYLRALPLPVIRQMFKATNQAGRPAVIYVHPWEAYAQTPRLPLSRWDQFVLYYGIPSIGKLEKLLQTFQFDTMQAIFLAD